MFRILLSLGSFFKTLVTNFDEVNLFLRFELFFGNMLTWVLDEVYGVPL